MYLAVVPHFRLGLYYGLIKSSVHDWVIFSFIRCSSVSLKHTTFILRQRRAILSTISYDKESLAWMAS